MASNQELACVYAALILQDDEITTEGNEIVKIMKSFPNRAMIQEMIQELARTNEFKKIAETVQTCVDKMKQSGRFGISLKNADGTLSSRTDQ